MNKSNIWSLQTYPLSDFQTDFNILKQTIQIKKVNDELLEQLSSSLRFIIYYCKKHGIPLPESEKIIDLCDKAMNIEKKLPSTDNLHQRNQPQNGQSLKTITL